VRGASSSGHLFVFTSRRGDRVKILVWDRGGFVLYYKRLERGRFRLPAIAPGATSVTLDERALDALLDGIDVDVPAHKRSRSRAH
jgi:transposase